MSDINEEEEQEYEVEFISTATKTVFAHSQEEAEDLAQDMMMNLEDDFFLRGEIEVRVEPVEGR